MSERVAAAAIIDDFEFVKQRSLWRDAFERLISNKAAMLGLFMSAVVPFTAAFGSWLASKDYLRTNIFRIADGPTSDY